MTDFDPYPSTLHVFWPWSEPPTEVEIEFALGEGAEREEGPEAVGQDILWVRSFSVPDLPTSVLLWASPIDEVPFRIDDADVHWTAEERESLSRSRWLLGVETVLDPEDPVGSYQQQLQMCRRLSPDSPAIYDASSYHLRSGSLVDLLTETNVPPRNSELFRIHAVHDGDRDLVGDEDRGRGRSKKHEGLCWVHTHGLARVMFPDVELVQIPIDRMQAAAWLITNFVDRMLGDDLPPPDTSFDVGREIRLAWRDWDDAVRELPQDALGGFDDRDDGEEHRGPRIVLFDSKPRGWIRKRWVPPLGVLARIDGGSAVGAVSRHETERMARLARERWPELGMLFARHGRKKDWTFLVKLGYRVDGGKPDEREHLWFEVQEIVPDRLRGRLLNQPLQIDRMSEDQEDWHNLEILTDWRIYSPLGEFTPENVRYVSTSSN